MAGENQVAETGCEALYLRFDAAGHVKCRPVRHMTICPANMLAFRCTRGIKQSWLRKQDKWPFGMLALPGLTFGRGNLVERVAEVQCARTPARLVSPRDRTVQRPIDLEYTHAVAIARQLTAITSWQALSHKLHYLTRSDIEQHHARRRQFIDRANWPTGADFATHTSEIRSKCVSNSLSAAARHRPPNCVPGQAKHYCYRSTRHHVDRQLGVPGESGN